MKVVKKPWGQEEILVEDACLIKKLTLHDETSTHFHQTRKELLIPISGEGKIIIDDNVIVLEKMKPIQIEPKKVHKLIPTSEELIVIEVSNSTLDDVVRIADKYNRITKLTTSSGCYL